jgi:hypothetical protein
MYNLELAFRAEESFRMRFDEWVKMSQDSAKINFDPPSCHRVTPEVCRLSLKFWSGLVARSSHGVLRIEVSDGTIELEDVMFLRNLRRTALSRLYTICYENHLSSVFSLGTGPNSRIKSVYLLELITSHDFLWFFWLHDRRNDE